MKEELLRFLTSNPDSYYCRICLSLQLRVSHNEVRSLLPTIGFVAPGIVTTVAECAQCRNVRTVFGYQPPRPRKRRERQADGADNP